MNLKQLLLAIALSRLTISAPTNSSCPSSPYPLCKDLMIAVTATANNTLLPTYPNSTSPTAFYEYFGSLKFSRTPPFTNTVSGTFNLSATYCEPTIKMEGRNAVQLLVHGVAYTKVIGNRPCSSILTRSSHTGVASTIPIQSSRENIAGLPMPNPKATQPYPSTA